MNYLYVKQLNVIEARLVAITTLLESNDLEGVRALVNLTEPLWVNQYGKYHMVSDLHARTAICKAVHLSPSRYNGTEVVRMELNEEQCCKFCEKIYKKQFAKE
jgi:hypothetical protein